MRTFLGGLLPIVATIALGLPAHVAAQGVVTIPGRPDTIVVREGSFTVERATNASGLPRATVISKTSRGVGFCVVEFDYSTLQMVSLVDAQARNLFKDAGFPPPAIVLSSEWARAFQSRNENRIVLSIIYYEQNGRVGNLIKSCNELGNEIIGVNFLRNSN